MLKENTALPSVHKEYVGYAAYNSGGLEDRAVLREFYCISCTSWIASLTTTSKHPRERKPGSRYESIPGTSGVVRSRHDSCLEHN